MSQPGQRYLDELDTAIKRKTEKVKEQQKKKDIAVRRHETMVKKRINLPNVSTSRDAVNIPQLDKAVERTFAQRVEETETLVTLTSELEDLKSELKRALKYIMKGGKILKKSQSKTKQVTRKSRQVKKKSRKVTRKIRSK